MSPISRRAHTKDMILYRFEADEELKDLEENLQRLTVGIPDVTTNEVPRNYQCHTAGVFGRFSRLLRRVAQAINETQKDQNVL